MDGVIGTAKHGRQHRTRPHRNMNITYTMYKLITFSMGPRARSVMYTRVI